MEAFQTLQKQRLSVFGWFRRIQTIYAKKLSISTIWILPLHTNLIICLHPFISNHKLYHHMKRCSRRKLEFGWEYLALIHNQHKYPLTETHIFSTQLCSSVGWVVESGNAQAGVDWNLIKGRTRAAMCIICGGWRRRWRLVITSAWGVSRHIITAARLRCTHETSTREHARADFTQRNARGPRSPAQIDDRRS